MNGAAILTLPAPAKLNLFLHITGRRSDGYHTLESLFVLVDHGDIVSLARREDDAIVRSQGPANVPADADLAVAAAQLLKRECKVSSGITIGIDKRIPMGGGLGGGSSDAATVLLGLNRLWGLGLSRAALMDFARELGADVPFFVFGRPAFATGVGEMLTPVSLPPTCFVVLVPAVQVQTASIFAAAELTRNSPSVRIIVFSEGYGRNDLQAVAIARFAEIADCLAALERAQHVAGARMTGSGGCVFAAFATEEAAAQALSQIRRGRVMVGFLAKTLERHPLWHFAQV